MSSRRHTLLDRVLSRHRVVVVGWLLVVATAGALLAPRAGAVVKSIGFTASGSDSQIAANILQNDFSFSSLNTTAVVLHSASMTTDDDAFQVQVSLANTWLRNQNSVLQVRDYTGGDTTLVSADHHTTAMLVVLAGDDSAQQAAIPQLRQSLQGLGIEHHVAGRAATNYDLKAVSEQDLKHAELITFPLILLLLLVAFRGVVAALIPLMLGGVSIVLALSLVAVIGSHTDLSVFVINVSTMFGLGLGIDYSLIVVSRYRAELAEGRDVRDAIRTTMATAGRSVVYSGVIVLLGMLTVSLLLDLTVVRSISLGVSLVALAAVLSALTLLPALLLLLGRRIDWLSIRRRPRDATTATTGFWYRASQRITRRPWSWLGLSLVVLLLLAFPVHDLQLTGSDPDLLPSTSDSVVGAHALNSAFGPNRLTPVELVIRTPKPDGVWTPRLLDDVAQVTAAARHDSRVDTVASLATVAGAFGMNVTALNPAAVQQDPRLQIAAGRLVSTAGDTTVIDIVSKFGPYSSQQESLVRDLRARALPGLDGIAAEVHVGGSAATFIDFRDRLYGEFPGLVAVVLLISFVILMMFFRSVVLPLKAIVLNVLSTLATYGALVLVFEYGWGSRVAGFTPLGKVTAVTPAVLFVILFGLTTDYEVFVLSRVREIYRATGDSTASVALGLQETAGIITTAGFTFMGVFLSFATAGILTIKELGIGLSIGILIDTTIIRLILVPATMRLLGRANWWMPAWLDRLLPEPGHGENEPVSVIGVRQHDIIGDKVGVEQ